MEILRTPDGRFDSLPEYAFAPHYVEVPCGDGDATLRIHYIDEGEPGAPVVLCMHGEPSWSYLYRNMVGPLVGAGFRVVAPDHAGFGRSDKPARQEDYTYGRHVEWMRSALLDPTGLDLSGVTLVCQDWGGLVGLRLVAEHPDRFARVVTANTGLPTGDVPMPDAFFAWQRFSQEVPEMPIGRIVAMGCRSALDDAVVAAYDAPFPDETYKAGARIFPMLVPTAPDDPAASANRAAWEVLRTFTKPWLCAFSDADPITAGGDRVFRELVPGAAGRAHTTIEGGGHFLQEDRPAELAAAIVDFIAANP